MSYERIRYNEPIDGSRSRRCMNTRCSEPMDGSRYRIDLCPSCRFIGKIFFAIGAIVAGAIVKLLS